jgi:hypothetical protein
VVDDFEIKYVGQEHAEHLKASIEKHYQISCDWTGSAYCGLTSDWDNKLKFVDLYMPGYIKAAFHKFQHPTPTRPANAPHTWNPPIYGANTQYIVAQKDIPPLTQKDITRIQQLAGTLLYYARAVDPTLILPVNILTSNQTQATAATADTVIKSLNYRVTHPDAKLRYHASDMILNIQCDSSYLSERESKSRAGLCFYMGSNIDSK